MALSVRVGAAAAAVLAARLGGAAANVVAVVILSRALPPDAVGLVLTALACALLAELAVGMGREGVAIRVLPQGDAGAAGAYLRSLARLARRTAPAAALGAGVSVWALSGGSATLGVVLLTGALPPLGGFVRVASRLTHAAGRVAESAVLFTLVRPVLFVLALAALASVGALTVVSAMAAAAAAVLLTALVQWVRLRSLLPARHRPPGPADPAWARDGRSLLLTTLLLGDKPALVTALAAAVVSEAAVAQLGVALRIAGLLMLGSGALIAALGPGVSRAWGRGDRVGAVRLGAAIPRVAAPVVAAGVLAVWLAAPWVMGLFGDAYRAGAGALRVLVLMPLVTACAGPSLLMLTAAGRADQGARAALVGAPVLAAGVLLGSLGGVVGIALGVLLGHAVWEVMLARGLARTVRVSLWLPFGPRRPRPAA